ncbi:M-phase phosphoprotein 8 [Pseudogymnoascus australis]
MVGPVRPKRKAQRTTTTHGYRRALKDIRQPGKRATLESRKGYRKLLEDLRKREDNLTKMKPAKKNGKGDPENDEEYEVERVLDSRISNGELKLYVLWKGFSMEEATWEPRSNLENSTEAIDEYFLAYPGNPGGPDATNRFGRPSLKATEKAT